MDIQFSDFDESEDDSESNVYDDLDETIEAIAQALADPQRVGDEHLASTFRKAVGLTRGMIKPENWEDYTLGPGLAEFTAEGTSDKAKISMLYMVHTGGRELPSNVWHPRMVTFLEIMHVFENPTFFIHHPIDGDPLVKVDGVDEARKLVSVYLDAHNRAYTSTAEMAFLVSFAQAALLDASPTTEVYITASSFATTDPRYIAPTGEDRDRFHLYVHYDECSLSVRFSNRPLLDLVKALETHLSTHSRTVH